MVIWIYCLIPMNQILLFTVSPDEHRNSATNNENLSIVSESRKVKCRYYCISAVIGTYCIEMQTQKGFPKPNLVPFPSPHLIISVV